MKMIAGKSYYGDHATNSEEVARFQESVEETFKMAGVSNIGDFLPVLRWMDLQGLKKRVRLAKYRDDFLQSLIDELRGRRDHDDGVEEEKTMIGVLLSLQKTDPEYYTDQIIKSLIIVSPKTLLQDCFALRLGFLNYIFLELDSLTLKTSLAIVHGFTKSKLTTSEM